MKKSGYIYIAVLLLLSSCTSRMAPVQYSATERRMTDSLKGFDAKMAATIRPYRDSMDAEMNQVLVVSDTVLTKQMPESDLGNILSEILLQKAEKYGKRHVDVAMINFGGIRLPQLPKGNVTRGQAFELMPFDNLLVLLELNGDLTQQLFDRMAGAGGVPLAGARYVISKDKKAINITIQGKPFDPSKKYVFALSDYLANGGEKLDMLKPVPQIETGVLLRDIFIEGFKDIHARGEHLKSIKDGRVTIQQ
ncbi:MAG: 5'-nucleotidase C-terminal domain-containing protein [Bacteroidetes bacterium]|nr:5'-nucleotidase C-terminal domain-containing protein [Bacteroidota bacterium]